MPHVFPPTGRAPSLRALLAAVGCVWVVSIVGIVAFLPDWATRAQFGDMFGAVNALFSGFAFAILILALWLQRQELSLQREELQHTREELRRTADAQEATLAVLREQVALLTVSSQVSALAALLEAHQRTKHKDADAVGFKLERMERDLDTRLTALGLSIGAKHPVG